VSNPIFLNNSVDIEAFDTLLLEVDKLTNFVKGNIIELEIHSNSKNHIAFPTSPSFFNKITRNIENISKNLGVDESCLSENNFHKETALNCYDISIEQFEENILDIDLDGYKITTVDPPRYMEIKNSRKFKYSSFSLTGNDDAFKPSKLPFFERSTLSASKSRWFSRKERVEGILRWIPDIIEPSMEKKTPYPLLFHSSLENHQYEYGKIFDWAFNNRNKNLILSIIHHAVKLMKTFGLTSFQISNIDNDHNFLSKLCENYGFDKIHTIKIYRKEV
jgi:hypothetical protein